jgi:nucleoside-diphosphate-sugar epimerase
MTFLILGTGFIGSALLAKSEGIYYATTTTPSKLPFLKAKKSFLLRGDEKERLKDVLEECEGLIILIAPKNAEKYAETYLVTTRAVTYALQDREKPFYLLYTSSTRVYEGLGGKWVDENSQLAPISPQGKVLYEAEKFLLALGNSRIITCILRLGGIFGPGREIEKRVKHFSGMELAGTGGEPTNHVHIEDIVRAIDFCKENRLQGVYNLVNDSHPTRKELYENLAKSLNLDAPRWNPQLKSTHGCGTSVSNQKIKEAGYVFSIPFLD